MSPYIESLGDADTAAERIVAHILNDIDARRGTLRDALDAIDEDIVDDMVSGWVEHIEQELSDVPGGGRWGYYANDD